MLLIETLSCKPQGLRYDSKWGHWILQFTKTFHLHHDPGVLPGDKGGPAR
jgi:hypothetical protein